MSKCDPDVAAVAMATVEVRVSNVRSSGHTDFDYIGDFTYTPKKGDFVDECGNVDAKNLVTPFDVKFQLKTKKVMVDGHERKAKLKKNRNRSIWIVQGDDKPGPENVAPTEDADVTVPKKGAKRELYLKGKNTPTLTYRYSLVLKLDNGKLLVDDPRIINRRL